MHPSKGTRLRAEGEVVKNGRNVIVSDVSVYDDTGKMTAKGVFEVFVLE
jgi:acyl-coenzyme A thioesterase PaaI-like protein